MTVRHRVGRLLAGLLAVATVVGAAGCGADDQALPDHRIPADPPRPVGMRDPAVVPSAATNSPGSCNPRASLRPTGPLPPPRQMPARTAMARIVQRGRLVVGVDQNSYQFGFRDPLTGELAGFDIDIAREIGRASCRERV